MSVGLLDELLLVTGLALLLQMNFRAEHCQKVYDTGTSPNGAGGCGASITKEDWLALYDLAEEKGENTFALIGGTKNNRATCMMVVQWLPRLR